MGKTYKDRDRYDEKSQKGKQKFPRVPRIEKRSEPFLDKRRQTKYPEKWDDDSWDGVD